MLRYFQLFVLLALFLVSCEVQNPEHLPDPENVEVEKSILNSYFPKQHNYWFATSGNSSYLNGRCPQVDFRDKYVVVNYEISNTLDPESIAVLNVFMERQEWEDGNYVWKAVVDKYFLPNQSNRVRINNCFPKGEYRLWYGFYLKKDSLKEYPRLYKNTCNLTIE